MTEIQLTPSVIVSIILSITLIIIIICLSKFGFKRIKIKLKLGKDKILHIDTKKGNIRGKNEKKRKLLTSKIDSKKGKKGAVVLKKQKKIIKVKKNSDKNRR